MILKNYARIADMGIYYTINIEMYTIEYPILKIT